METIERATVDLILNAAEGAGGKSIIVAGYDVGGMIAFACARDHAARIDGAVVMNTVIPGIDPWQKVISNPRIWHFAFHAVPDIPELLVAGHQRDYFDFFYNFMAKDPRALPATARETYVRGYARAEALQAGFDWYRAFEKDASHNEVSQPLETPILYLRGDADGRSVSEYVTGLRSAGAMNLHSRTLVDSGEYAPEEAPEQLVEALREFARTCDATLSCN